MNDDVEIEVEDDQRLPVNHNPPIMYEYYNTVTTYIAQYGWYLLILAICLYFLWKKFLQPMINNYSRRSSQLSAHKKFDASEIERRQVAMDAHRRRLQEEHDRKAAAHAVKQAELEAKKQQEKLEDWERHQAGLGYRSKVKKAEESEPQANFIPKAKRRLRDNDYSPLTGSEGGQNSWRRERRGPAAGGG